MKLILSGWNSWCHLLNCHGLCWQNFDRVLSSTFRVFRGTPPGAVTFPPLSADPPSSPAVICLTPHFDVLHLIIDTSSSCALYHSDAIPHDRHHSPGWLHNWRSSSPGTWPPAQSHSDTCMSLTSIRKCLEFICWRFVLMCIWQQGGLQHRQTFYTSFVNDDWSSWHWTSSRYWLVLVWCSSQDWACL